MWGSGDLACPNSGVTGRVTGSSTAADITSFAGILLLAQSLPVDGFLFPIPSSISMNGVSFNWYMPLTPFETIFLSMIMIQIFVLRWLDILPININNILHGDPSGRKKRGATSSINSCDSPSDDDAVTGSVFNLVRKLDGQDCFLRTICQLSASKNSIALPEETKRTLKGIELFSKRHSQSCVRSNTTTSTDIEPFAEALFLGSTLADNQENITNNICQQKYALCPLSTDDLNHYSGIIFNSF